MSESASKQISRDTTTFELWDRHIPFSDFDEMCDLDVVTHVVVERAEPEVYHYLHESGIAFHNGALEVVWANHRLHEINTDNELIRGSSSRDGGYTWSLATIVVEAPTNGSTSFNHPVVASVGAKLWGFFTRWDNERPSTEIFTMDDATRVWTTTRTVIPTFVPFRPPMRMANGNWIVSGESYWYEAAVAISDGDDFGSWKLVVIPNPHEIELMFAETTIFQRGDQMVAICRPKNPGNAPVSVSDDFGITWTALEKSNMPVANTQPYCGRLSTGQQYYITSNLEEDRTLMSIALTKPGGEKFERIWKIRHQKYPKVRLFGGWGGGSRVGQNTEWSYPAAIEHNCNLYVSYTQGKEDCALSIIPVRVLAVD